MGTPIYSPAHAKVLWGGKKEDFGYTIDLLLEDGRKMRFASLYKILVEKDQKLNAGEVIGKVGASARSATGPRGRSGPTCAPARTQTSRCASTRRRTSS